MEQCFRITLLMFLLIGYLQANPVPRTDLPKFNIKNLGFPFLEDVICGANVTFTSPTNVEETCLVAALERFIGGLEQARSCLEGVDRVNQTLRSIRRSYPTNTNHPPPSQCSWDNEEYRKPFPDFVKDMETLVESFNQKNN